MDNEAEFSLACGDYDRIQALVTGRVTVASGRLKITTMATGPLLAGAARADFDITEHSLSSYVMSLDDEDPPYVAVPVFPSRMFRHNAVYVRRDSRLTQPEELAGATVGIQAWHITAMVWIRGIFADRHDVPLDSVRYVLGGLDRAGAAIPSRARPPAGVRIETAPAGSSLVDLLLDGRIDAIYAPGAPGAFSAPDRSVRRLLADPVAAEQDYFRATRIFPLMHVLVLRRVLVTAYPDLPDELLTAFTASKAVAQHAVAETAEVHAMEPWLYAHAEATRELMGEDFWAYGLEANRDALSTFLRYAHEQGLTARRWTPEGIFEYR